MIVWNDAHIDDKASLPAYDDDHAFERLPSYRRGSHARYHPYGHYTPSLLQRLEVCTEASSGHTNANGCLQLWPGVQSSDHASHSGIDATVSSDPPSYESAETLTVLESLGYTLELRTIPRQVPPSLLASVR